MLNSLLQISTFNLCFVITLIDKVSLSVLERGGEGRGGEGGGGKGREDESNLPFLCIFIQATLSL